MGINVSNKWDTTENDQDSVSLEFIKHLYLFRAKGQLSRLHDCISALQNPDGTVYLGSPPLTEVLSFQYQVFFQLCVEAVVDAPNTWELLREHPDLLEPLNQVLYGAARHWERGARSFTASDLLDSTNVRVEETRIDFKAQIEDLMYLLKTPSQLPGRVPVDSVVEKLSKRLKKLEPLIEDDNTQGELRYFWRRWIDEGIGVRLEERDRPTVLEFRSDQEWKTAAENIRHLGTLMTRIGSLTPLDLCQPLGVIGYCPPDSLSWEDILRQLARGPDRELAELHAAMLRDAVRLRDFLLLLILDVPPKAPTTALFDLVCLAERYPKFDAPTMAEAIQERWDLLLSNGDAPEDLTRPYQRLIDYDPLKIAGWSAEGAVFLDRLRRLSRLR